MGLALGETKLDFRHAAIVEVEAQGHERHAFAGDGGVQLVELAALQKQLPLAPLGVLKVAGALVRRDMAVDEKELVAFGVRESLDQGAAAVAQRLHFAPRK